MGTGLSCSGLFPLKARPTRSSLAAISGTHQCSHSWLPSDADHASLKLTVQALHLNVLLLPFSVIFVHLLHIHVCEHDLEHDHEHTHEHERGRERTHEHEREREPGHEHKCKYNMSINISTDIYEQM